MQGTEGLSVGRMVHLDGHRYDDNSPACVPAVISEVAGDDFYVTALPSPNVWSDGNQPYQGTWHWPEES